LVVNKESELTFNELFLGSSAIILYDPLKWGDDALTYAISIIFDPFKPYDRIKGKESSDLLL